MAGSGELSKSKLAIGRLTRMPARREAVDQTPDPPPAGSTFSEEPSAQTRLIISVCLELLMDEKPFLLRCHPTINLARSLNVFRHDLHQAGFRDLSDRPRDRARSLKWMAEIAEERGDVDGAIVLYELAHRSWHNVGGHRRLKALRDLKESYLRG